MYKYKLKRKQEESLLALNVTEEEFKVMFSTRDDDDINDESGYLDDDIFYPLLTTYNRFLRVEDKIERYFSVGLNEKPRIYAKVIHGYRTQKTHQRLLEQGLHSSPTSQHFFGEAIDIHFFIRENNGWYKRVYPNLSKLEYTNIFGDTVVLEELDKHFFILANALFKGDFCIQQLILYNWGMHIGFSTKRVNVKRYFADTRQ